ncbi:Phage-related lysozyme (muraminidase) [Yersinia rohdei]|uniref:Lysozyme n=1 Tax=Yersinia rohdei TaxID=29485 RepID=A0A0U1HUS0_YERRO|nr:glycoside hydrolase family protein [Yersinia rohdei]CQI92533.1 Phage-related lysozyme (muraminidase) [Yersinia rohdei]
MDLSTQLKQFEGTKKYQATKGYFKNDKFWTYNDHLGNPTIGYGHLIIKGESFPNGLTEQEADLLLAADIEIARQGVSKLKLNLPSESRWNDFLIMMVFQLGLKGTQGFKRFLAALSKGSFANAIIELKDSKWYKQTPNRVEQMITYVIRG